MSDLRLGLCCINTVLRERGIFSSRTCRLDTANNKGVDYVRDLARKNLMDLIPIIIWNELNGIKVFRLSSEIFPHINNPKLNFTYQVEDFKDILQNIGHIVNTLGHRLTFHPGQFNIIGAKDPIILENTIAELTTHAKVFDLIGCDKNSIMVVHGGGVYGDKSATIKRWVKNYLELPSCIKNRLVLENCEKSFSVSDCLQISELAGGDLPVVFDIHHYECYSLLHPKEKQAPIDELMPRIISTWKPKGIRPKFHISEQGSGKTGHHSDYISKIPDIFWTTCKHTPFDLMIEAKAKEQAIFKLYDMYPQLCINDHVPNEFVYDFIDNYPYIFDDYVN